VVAEEGGSGGGEDCFANEGSIVCKLLGTRNQLLSFIWEPLLPTLLLLFSRVSNTSSSSSGGSCSRLVKRFKSSSLRSFFKVFIRAEVLFRDVERPLPFRSVETK